MQQSTQAETRPSDSELSQPMLSGFKRQICRLRTFAAGMVLLSAGVSLVSQRLQPSVYGLGYGLNGSLRASPSGWNFELTDSSVTDMSFGWGVGAADEKPEGKYWPSYDAQNDYGYERYLFIPHWCVVAIWLLLWTLCKLLSYRYMPAGGVRRLARKFTGLCRAKPRLAFPLLVLILCPTAFAIWQYDRNVHDRAAIYEALREFARGRNVVSDTKCKLESYPTMMIERCLLLFLNDTSPWSLRLRPGVGGRIMRVKVIAGKFRIPIWRLRFLCLAKALEATAPDIVLEADDRISRQIEHMKTNFASSAGFDELGETWLIKDDPHLREFLLSVKSRLESARAVNDG